MNLAKLAKLAHVSVSTVSKAFSGSREISEETREMILNLAKETGCFEKYYKPKYGRKLIAVICPELLGVHYSAMATCIERNIAEKGGTMLLSFSNFSPKAQRELIEYYTTFAHTDGIIVIEPTEKIRTSSKIPIVQISLGEDTGNVHTVNMEIAPGMRAALRHLKQMGHTKIGFIGETHTPMEYEVFCTYMKENELAVLPEFLSINEHRFYDCGYYGMEELLKRAERPTAVFGAYSHVSLGMLQKLREAQLRVPEDISVLCMDDIEVSPYRDVELASIRMHLTTLCDEAVSLLYQSFQSGASPIKHTITIERDFSPGASIADIS